MKQEEKIKSKKQKVRITLQNPKNFSYLLIVLLLVFLALNVVNSQTISPIYYQVANDDKNGAVSFLQKINGLPIFNSQLKNFENVFGSALITDVFKADSIRNKRINNLEQYLIKSPESRDILNSLYLIYKEKGDEKTAEKYLIRARAVDPTIGL